MSLLFIPLFQSLDKIKEQSALIKAQIKNNRYHWIIDELSKNKMNSDIKEAPIPIGRNTISDPSVSSSNKNTKEIISQT